jgi:RNA polymerase sigma-70 factor (ECF subfamily)
MTNDQALFWELLAPEITRANLFCRKLTGNREKGDDLFQDGLLAALTKFGSLRDRGAFRPWLYRILINTYHSRIRLQWWRRLVPLTAEVESSLPSDDPTGRYTARRRLEEGLRKLSTEDRTLIVLHELEGWPLAELAAVYGRSAGALAAKLVRTRGKLKKILYQHTDKIDETLPVPVEDNG